MKIIEKYIDKSKMISVYCIGTTCVPGDALGPIVGSMLKEKENMTNINIIGDINKPLTYPKIQRIEENSNNIFVDSALGSKENIGKVIINNGIIIPGNAVKKHNRKILNGITIKAIIAEDKRSFKLNMIQLNRIKIRDIYPIAQFISENIYKTIVKYE